jgi:putative DNA primase/helicase
MTLYKQQPINHPNFEMIPEELKQHPKWMLWKAIPDKKDRNKMTKPPCNLKGNLASKNDPKNWFTFDQVKEAFLKGGFSGIGIVIDETDDLICIDLDDIGEMKNLPDEKYKMTLQSYTELSPSESGLHIWIKGEKPEWMGTKKNGFEVYGGTCSFLTVTGNTFHQTAAPIVENQKMIDYIAAKHFKEDDEAAEDATSENGLTDNEVLQIALQNDMTKKLFSGDFSDYKTDSKNDQSKADFALCYDLAKITKDAAQIERLFMKSGLYRKPPLKHKSYPQRTAKKALTEVNKKVQPQKEKDNVFNHPNKYFTYNHQGQLKFNTHLVKDEILAEMPIFRSDIGILRYENGVYKRSHKDDIKHIIQNRIEKEATISRKNEITDLILHQHKAIPLSDFNSKHRILNLKNGIYNITDGTFHSHTKKLLWTIQHPIEYNSNARCPAILDFLHDILDAESVQFLIEWIAYMMLPYTDTDKIVFLYGSGGNGKGVLLNIIMNLLGVENISNMSLNDLEEDKFSRANLYGKLSNICGDIDNRILTNTGIIKSLTGGDFVYAQFKGVDGFSFKSFAKLMFSANELPMSKDKTEGWFRRLFILPFNKKVPEEKRISRSELDKKLTSTEELSGLLNLVIAAVHRLEGNGYQFTVSQAAQVALDAYKFSHDKVEQFMIEEGSRDGRETMKQFYAAYQDWCRENGNVPEQRRKVKDKLIEKGFIVEVGTGNKEYVFGFSFSKHSAYYAEGFKIMR